MRNNLTPARRTAVAVAAIAACIPSVAILSTHSSPGTSHAFIYGILAGALVGVAILALTRVRHSR